MIGHRSGKFRMVVKNSRIMGDESQQIVLASNKQVNTMDEETRFIHT